MEELANDELDAKIAEMQLMLEQSQCANMHPNQYRSFKRLGSEEHFALWDAMWKLVQEKAIRKTKSVGS